MENLRAIKGLGDRLIEKIQEIMEKNTCSAYEKIKDIKASANSLYGYTRR